MPPEAAISRTSISAGQSRPNSGDAAPQGESPARNSGAVGRRAGAGLALPPTPAARGAGGGVGPACAGGGRRCDAGGRRGRARRLLGRCFAGVRLASAGGFGAANGAGRVGGGASGGGTVGEAGVAGGAVTTGRGSDGGSAGSRGLIRGHATIAAASAARAAARATLPQRMRSRRGCGGSGSTSPIGPRTPGFAPRSLSCAAQCLPSTPSTTSC